MFQSGKYGDANFTDNVSDTDFSTEMKMGPIDAVYTWVNGSDPIWKSERDFWYQQWIQEYDGPNRKIQNERRSSSKDDDASADYHFRDNDELRYSVRSLEKFAPWIRQIYIVTNGQVPTWLDQDNPRIKIVKHSEIFENTSHLPVFSSSSIESNLDRIPGLSDTFLYFNDDVFLGAPIWPDDFITPSGVQTIYLSHPVPLGDDAYPEYWAGGKDLTSDSPESKLGRELDDYGFVDDEQGGVRIEQLVGKVYASSACDVETEIPQSILDEVLSDDLPLGHGHINVTSLLAHQNPTSNDEVSETTERISALDTKSRIKLLALLDALPHCPNDHDLVADAIRSVINTFNERFSSSKHLRRVPSHMPLMMKRQILAELKRTFPQEFQQNSVHRFRHPRDLQVGFAYFNYLVNRPNFLYSTMCGLQDQRPDMARNCWLEEYHIHTLESLLYGMTPPAGFHDSFQRCLHNGSGLTGDLQFPTGAAKRIAVPIKDVERCIDMPKLRSNLQKEKGYRLKMGTDVTFHMLRDQNQTTMDQLQSTRDRRTKFICLNDDIKSPSVDLRFAFEQLLEELWPVPSIFELQTRPTAPNESNRVVSHEGGNSPYISYVFVFISGCTVILALFLRIWARRTRRKTT
ncbi:hypothetical protein N7451_008305 [Penicillium sp. IBT 35674x]|nr:hypothetical protein N7451_008305 [Penicillium sp. IBT 35674x]